MAPYPLSQTFLLHSRPTSTHTIFLDFDGTTVSGTAWNASPFFLPNGFYSGYTLDGDTTTFTDPEKEEIQKIWQRVTEDYAAFDVDVTTQDPGAAAIDRTDLADQNFGTRAMISSNGTASSTICSNNCGGIAYLDVFDMVGPNHNYYQPAWVFSHLLSNDNKNIAEATSHEVGHNFGLNHDGTSTLGYYTGHDMWAPIMGVGYNRPVVQWSKGEYADANNTAQDDLAIIASNGAPVIADDAGGTVGTASATLSGRKLITTTADQDVFNLGTCSGAVSVTAATPAPATPSPNLDIQLDLLNAASGVLDTDNPASAFVNRDTASGLSATVSASVASGTYYARVSGVGNGTGVTGYTDYASIGAYALTVTGCGTATVPGAPTVTSSTPGPGRVTVAFTPGSNGGSPITNFTAQCVSTNGGVTKSAGGATSPRVVTGLTPGKSYHCRVRATNAVGNGPFSGYGATVRGGQHCPVGAHGDQLHARSQPGDGGLHPRLQRW